MSLENSNKLIKDQKGEKGFSTALLLNFSPFENSFRELSDGIENVRLNTSASAIQCEGTQMINNLLSSDLLEGIDYSSPYHKNRNENVDKLGEILLDDSDNDNNSALHSSEKEQSDDEEIISNHSNAQEKEDESELILKEMSNQRNRDSKSPSNDNNNDCYNKIMGYHNTNKNPIGSSTNSNSNSNSHLPLKPPNGYLYSHFGSTNKSLSSSLMNGQQNKTDLNYSNEFNPSYQNSNGMMQLNNKDVYANYVNEMMYQQQLNNYSLGYYNMNMNSQIYLNYQNMNSTKLVYPQRPKELNYKRNKSNNLMIDQTTLKQQSAMKNNNPYLGIGNPQSTGFFPQQYTPANNRNLNGVVDQKMVIGAPNAPQQSNMNQSNNKKKKKKKEKKPKKNDDYLIEMFGRTGWICDQCNNFNYETRNKCNRCGIQKTPKKVYKLKKKQESSKKRIEQQQLQQLNPDDISRQKKDICEKNATDKKGVWNCICCRNVNFSFRIACNRCQLPKMQNDTPSSSSQPIPTTEKRRNGINPQRQLNCNNNDIYFNEINMNQILRNNKQGKDENRKAYFENI